METPPRPDRSEQLPEEEFRKKAESFGDITVSIESQLGSQLTWLFDTEMFETDGTRVIRATEEISNEIVEMAKNATLKVLTKEVNPKNNDMIDGTITVLVSSEIILVAAFCQVISQDESEEICTHNMLCAVNPTQPEAELRYLLYYIQPYLEDYIVVEYQLERLKSATQLDQTHTIGTIAGLIESEELSLYNEHEPIISELSTEIREQFGTAKFLLTERLLSLQTKLMTQFTFENLSRLQDEDILGWPGGITEEMFNQFLPKIQAVYNGLNELVFVSQTQQIPIPNVEELLTQLMIKDRVAYLIPALQRFFRYFPTYAEIVQNYNSMIELEKLVANNATKQDGKILLKFNSTLEIRTLAAEFEQLTFPTISQEAISDLNTQLNTSPDDDTPEFGEELAPAILILQTLKQDLINYLSQVAIQNTQVDLE